MRLLNPTRVVVLANVLVLLAMLPVQEAVTRMQQYAAPDGVPKPAAAEFIPAIGSNTQEADLALALSGGGSRSAYYTIGVLKGLYDRGYLQEADAISAVSGGGYALYWLLSQSQSFYRAGADPQALPSQKALTAPQLIEQHPGSLGDAVFDDAQWRQRNSYIQLKSRVVPYGPAVLYALRHWVPLRESYAYFVDRFARCSETQTVYCPQLNSSPLLMDFQPAIRASRLPFFQHNFAIATRSKNRWEGLVQASPFRFGNEAFGYHAWNSQDDMPQRKAVGVSGAAVKYFLPYQLPDYLYGRTGAGQGITAYDGSGAEIKGEGEKLGALSLLERGIPNIVILDTELDPNYDFEAYTTLKKLAASRGIEFSIATIDAYLQAKEQAALLEYRQGFGPLLAMAPALEGRAVLPAAAGDSSGARKVIHVRYLKMSLSTQLFSYDVKEKEGQRFCGKGADFAVLDERNELDRPVINGRRVLQRSRVPKLGSTPLSQGHYMAAVLDYTNYLERIYPDGSIGKPHSGLSKYTSYQFPMISTLDQAYAPDQAEALVGLGYLQALRVSFADQPAAKASQPVPLAAQSFTCRENRAAALMAPTLIDPQTIYDAPK